MKKVYYVSTNVRFSRRITEIDASEITDKTFVRAKDGKRKHLFTRDSDLCRAYKQDEVQVGFLNRLDAEIFVYREYDRLSSIVSEWIARLNETTDLCELTDDSIIKHQIMIQSDNNDEHKAIVDVFESKGFKIMQPGKAFDNRTTVCADMRTFTVLTRAPLPGGISFEEFINEARGPQA